MVLSSEDRFLAIDIPRLRQAPAIAGYGALGIDGVCIIDLVWSKDLIPQ
jgi:hypothetical protein